jgi:hypothetical protein
MEWLDCATTLYVSLPDPGQDGTTFGTIAACLFRSHMGGV